MLKRKKKRERERERERREEKKIHFESRFYFTYCNERNKQKLKEHTPITTTISQFFLP